jgi:hypothetical protein
LTRIFTVYSYSPVTKSYRMPLEHSVIPEIFFFIVQAQRACSFNAPPRLPTRIGPSAMTRTRPAGRVCSTGTRTRAGTRSGRRARRHSY